jgi:hypothetical protein
MSRNMIPIRWIEERAAESDYSHRVGNDEMVVLFAADFHASLSTPKTSSDEDAGGMRITVRNAHEARSIKIAWSRSPEVPKILWPIFWGAYAWAFKRAPPHLRRDILSALTTNDGSRRLRLELGLDFYIDFNNARTRIDSAVAQEADRT